MKRLIVATIIVLTVSFLLYGDSHEKSNKPGPEPGQKAPKGEDSGA